MSNKRVPKPASGKSRIPALALSSIAIVLAAGYIVFALGVLRLETVVALDTPQLALISSALGRGWIKGSGRERRLEAQLLRRKWLALDARSKHEQAEQIAKTLGGMGVRNAHIGIGSRPVIEIQNGLVAYVQGGRL